MELLTEFIKTRNHPNQFSQCNTDKSSQFTYNLKGKTRGLQVACSNCGINISIRVGSESSTQVAHMLLDTHDNFKGIN